MYYIIQDNGEKGLERYRICSHLPFHCIKIKLWCLSSLLLLLYQKKLEKPDFLWVSTMLTRLKCPFTTLLLVFPCLSSRKSDWDIVTVQYINRLAFILQLIIIFEWGSQFIQIESTKIGLKILELGLQWVA